MPVTNDPPARRCSECNKPLDTRNPKAVTCGTNCRSKRSRRLKALYAENEELQQLDASAEALTAEMRLAVRGHLNDRIEKVMDKTLEPIVREAITEDVLRSIQSLLALTPAAVQALMEDLTQDHSLDRRQKAYTLLLKYTAGNAPLVPSVDPNPPAISVVFPGMERPQLSAVESTAEQLASEDQFECNSCGQIKEDADRAAPGSERCVECHQMLLQRRDEIVASSGKRAHG